jgi:hypothetical protein
MRKLFFPAENLKNRQRLGLKLAAPNIQGLVLFFCRIPSSTSHQRFGFPPRPASNKWPMQKKQYIHLGGAGLTGDLVDCLDFSDYSAGVYTLSRGLVYSTSTCCMFSYTPWKLERRLAFILSLVMGGSICGSISHAASQRSTDPRRDQCSQRMSAPD